jgi:3-methyladenine DNA glycosylase AlkD
MTLPEILRRLEQFGDPQTKKTLLRHGAREPLYGVRVADLKKIQKAVKRDHALALALYDTGNYDAMYLAGLIADDAQMTKKDLQRWAERSYGGISDYTVPWVASQGRYGEAMGRKWITSAKPHVAAAGWHTIACVAALVPDEELDIPAYAALLDKAAAAIHKAPDRVRPAINTFIAAAGGYILPLTAKAITTSKAIGAVSIAADGGTRLLTPASVMIDKMKARRVLGKKRAMVKC